MKKNDAKSLKKLWAEVQINLLSILSRVIRNVEKLNQSFQCLLTLAQKNKVIDAIGKKKKKRHLNVIILLMCKN